MPIVTYYLPVKSITSHLQETRYFNENKNMYKYYQIYFIAVILYLKNFIIS